MDPNPFSIQVLFHHPASWDHSPNVRQMPLQSQKLFDLGIDLEVKFRTLRQLNFLDQNEGVD